MAKAQNVRLWEGQIKGRPGLDDFFTTALDSQVMFYEEFEKNSGTTYLMAVTQKSVYYWSGSAFTRIPWVYAGTATTNGTKTVTGTDTMWLTNARAGDRFKIDSVGTYGVIDTVDSDTQLTLLTTYANATGACTVDRYLGGATTDRFCRAVVDEKFCFSQGVDPVLYWDGSAATVAALSANCPACHAMVNFAHRLVIANTVESGTAYPHRVRWCVIDTVTDWTGNGSGYEDVAETTDPIMNMGVLANQLIVYKRNIIIHGRQTGYSIPAISFFGTKRVPNTGLIAYEGLLNRGDLHYFVSSNSIYTYDGSTLTDVGDLIRQEFYDTLNPACEEQIITFYIEEFDEWYIFVPLAPNTTLTGAWVLNLTAGTFATATFPAITGVGYYSRQASLTFDSAPWTFDMAPGRYDDQRGLSGSKMNLVALSTYKTYNLTDESVDDAGAAIDVDIQTADYVARHFELPEGNNLILTEVEIGYLSVVDVDVVMQASVDGGVTWEQSQTITFTGEATNELQLKSVYFWLTGKSVRVRLWHNATTRMLNLATITPYVVDGGREGR